MPEKSAPPSPSPRAARLKSHERREAILDAATRLLLDGGLAQASTRRIAAAVGVSQPSLYAHFPTKEALSEALANRAFAALDRRMAMVRETKPERRLEALIRSYVAFALEEPAAYQIAFMVAHPGTPPTPEEMKEKPGYGAFSIFAGEIAALQAAGVVRDGDNATLAQTIWAGMHGLCALLLARPGFPWVAREALLAGHVALLTRGALADGTPPRA
jgi:AcrR family transcriptional regulator